MIKCFKYNIDNNKLQSFTYVNEDIEIKVNVTSMESVLKYKKEEKTIGQIIEIYREKRKVNESEGEAYFDLKETIPQDYLQKLQSNSNAYDYVQIMLPADQRRKNILEQFSKKLYDGENNFSDRFIKIKNMSVVGLTCEEAADNFTYTKPEFKAIPKTIHIIDDTISTGCTINIFLDNLKKAGLLTNETIVTATIIYNNAGSTKPC